MKVADVIKRVRATAGDVDALQFTDDQILSWINDGVRECAIDNDLCQRRISRSVVPGEYLFDLPLDILKIHTVIANGKHVSITSMQEFDSNYSELTMERGQPERGFIWANKLHLFPKNDKDEGFLIINYIFTPVEVTVDAELPLPVAYQPRIIDYCLAQVAQLDDDMNRYQIKMQEFRTGVQNLKYDERSEENSFPAMRIDDRDCGYGDWWG